MTIEPALRVELEVLAQAANLRVDQAIPLLCPDLSRRVVQRLCESGRVALGKRRLKKSDCVRLGDRLTVVLDPPARATAAPEEPLDVRFESQDWVVVHKPALQPTAPRNATERHCLANALLGRYPELEALGHSALEPGLLHRLDNGTSGLLVAARHAASFTAAARALRDGQWVKQYLALVTSDELPAQGRIVGRLCPDRRHPRRVLAQSVEVRPPDGNSASFARGQDEATEPAQVTRFAVVERLRGACYVEIAVSAAFRHQIRAHFAAAGWPLLNDVIYGAEREAALAPGRHALHAARVAWAGAAAFAGFDVSAPLPTDLEALLRERRLAPSLAGAGDS